MKTDKIQEILMHTLPLEKIYVTTCDNQHFNIIAVSDKFIGLNEVERHKMIYVPLTTHICSQKIHALTISTYTVEEWKKKI